jgi:hypothetical protein
LLGRSASTSSDSADDVRLKLVGDARIGATSKEASKKIEDKDVKESI